MNADLFLNEVARWRSDTMNPQTIDQILDTAASEDEAVAQLVAAGMPRGQAEETAAIAFESSPGDVVEAEV